MDTISSTPLHALKEIDFVPDLSPAVEENAEETSGIMDITNLEIHDIADFKKERDTVPEFSVPNNDNHTPPHRFMAKYGLSRARTVNSRGVTTKDGRKLDVLVPENDMIKFEYDVPIVIDGKILGWTCYNLLFSAISGDCITFNFRDSFDFGTLSNDGAKLKLKFCTRKRPDWRAILDEFDSAFADSNLY